MNIYNKTTKLALALTLLSVPCSAVEITCPDSYDLRTSSPFTQFPFRGEIKFEGEAPSPQLKQIGRNHLIECHYPNGSAKLELPAEFVCKQEGPRVDCTGE